VAGLADLLLEEAAFCVPGRCDWHSYEWKRSDTEREMSEVAPPSIACSIKPLYTIRRQYCLASRRARRIILRLHDEANMETA